MGRVVVVGSLNMDLIVSSPRIPVVGETILGNGFRTAPGGKGANQAVAAARLGAQVGMVGCLGVDSFAADLKNSLEESGVDLTHVRRDAQTSSGVALITVDEAGQNSIVVVPGSNYSLNAQDVQNAEALFMGAEVLLLQLEIPLEAVQRAAELARAHGVKVVLNPAPARPLPVELLKQVDFLVPNETESELLTGMPVKSLDDASAAARKLQELGAAAVILTLGAKGALLADKDGERLFPAFPVKAVDTTAAGDAFLGGLAAAFSEGRTLDEAVRWGNAAGALAATRIGAQPSLPQRTDLEKLLNEWTNVSKLGGD